LERFRAWLGRRSLLQVILGLPAILATPTAAHAAGLPRLVITPPGMEGLRQLLAHPNEWAETRQFVHGVLAADHELASIDDATLRAWFQSLRAWNMTLELEVGAIKEWSAIGLRTFGIEAPMWQRFLDLGADISAVCMDGPLAAARRFLHQTDAYALRQTADFVGAVRKRFPAFAIGDIEPFPSFPLADHVSWLAGLSDALRQDGVAPLDFYRIDPDWVAFDWGAAPSSGGAWNGVAQIQSLCRQKSIPFSLIYWASGYPLERKLGLTGDDTWYVGVMSEGYAYANVGGKPDQFVIESWVDAPPRIVPDSDPFTFTGSALALARKFAKP